MAQKVIFTLTIGLVAFIVVLLGALGAYVALGGPASARVMASQPSPLVAQVPQVPQTNGSSGQDGYAVSADDAASIALSSVPGSTLMQQPRLVNFSGAVAYEVSLDKGYVYVDASSGQIIYNQANGTQSRPGRRFRGPSR